VKGNHRSEIALAVRRKP